MSNPDDWFIISVDIGDEDCIKMQKTAVNALTGERIVLDHSFYDRVTREALAAYVELAFPKRDTLEPGRRVAFYSADIVQLAASLRSQANGEAA